MLAEVKNPIKFKKGAHVVWNKDMLPHNDIVLTITKGNYKKRGFEMVNYRTECMHKNTPDHSTYAHKLVKATDAEVKAGKRL